MTPQPRDGAVRQTASIPCVDALLFATVFAVPLFVFPAGLDRYVIPKEALFSILAWFSALAWTWHYFERAELGAALRRLLRHPVSLPLALFVLTSALSLVFGSVEYIPARGVTLGAASVVFFLILLDRLSARPGLCLPLLCAYLASVTLTALLALRQDWRPDPAALASMRASLSGAPPDWRFAVIGTAGNPNFAASGFILALPFAVCGSIFTLRAWGRGLFLLTALLLCAALLSTFSTAGMIATLVAVATLGAWLAARRVPGRAWLPALLVVVGVVGFHLAPNPLNARGRSYLAAATESPLWKHGYRPRLFIWKTTGLMMREHLFLGVGYGGYFPEHQKYQGLHYRRRGTPHELPRVGLVDYAHCVPLQRAAETGVAGLLALLWLGALGARAAWVAARAGGSGNWLQVAAGLGLLAGSVQALPDSPLYTCVGRVGILLLAAMLLAGGRTGAETGAPARRAPAARIAMFSALLALGAGGGARLAYPLLAQRALVGGNFAEAVHYDPQNALARQAYGNLLASRGVLPRAREELKLAYRYLPDTTAAELWERVSLAMGDVEDAVAARRAMLAVNPCYGPWYLPLASLLERQGDLTGAEEARALARRFAPLDAALPSD